MHIEQKHSLLIQLCIGEHLAELNEKPNEVNKPVNVSHGRRGARCRAIAGFFFQNIRILGPFEPVEQLRAEHYIEISLESCHQFQHNTFPEIIIVFLLVQYFLFFFLNKLLLLLNNNRINTERAVDSRTTQRVTLFNNNLNTHLY